MELVSTVNDTWKYFAAGSFVGFTLLLLLAYQTQPYTSLLATQNTVVEFASLSEAAAIKPLEHFNITVISEKLNTTSFDQDVDEKKNTTTSVDDNLMNTTSVDEDDEKPANKKNCNMFEGRWVYMPEEDPSYDSTKCPFMEEKMSCQKNGRPDSEYEKWRWEANDCDIPLFNGVDMLERLRNKRVIMAGDSLNRNMWMSLACLLYSSIPSSSVEVSAESPVYKVLKAKDYNCTVEFYWSPFLVEFVEKHASGRKVLVLDKLSPNSVQWKGADVMVFNSGHWWLHGGKMRSWDLFEYEGKLVEEMPIELAYERAMTAWSTWINKNVYVDPNKTTIFFRGLSAVHQTSADWCYNITQPIDEESIKSSPQRSDVLVNVIKNVIQGMSNIIQVKYLNITKLSQYRIDAHPSIYRSSQWQLMIKKFENSLTGYADCSHWCLPGLPDTWNRLLYAFLFYNTFGDMST
ncbi:protein trichome birefringence-like 43 [Spinacia oleracea]|uniref:Protein trichome birefringence-like 43 n=1 Tax=Spinacia oleracea TaxID=3562 RepID=A0A9R0I557_SPIOL|nr:protein trichome birefringence-like 43 [Spinacia oleracea]